MRQDLRIDDTGEINDAIGQVILEGADILNGDPGLRGQAFGKPTRGCDVRVFDVGQGLEVARGAMGQAPDLRCDKRGNDDRTQR